MVMVMEMVMRWRWVRLSVCQRTIGCRLCEEKSDVVVKMTWKSGTQRLLESQDPHPTAAGTYRGLIDIRNQRKWCDIAWENGWQIECGRSPGNHGCFTVVLWKDKSVKMTPLWPTVPNNQTLKDIWPWRACGELDWYWQTLWWPDRRHHLSRLAFLSCWWSQAVRTNRNQNETLLVEMTEALTTTRTTWATWASCCSTDDENVSASLGCFLSWLNTMRLSSWCKMWPS